MTQNHIHNLMTQLVEEQKSLWRIHHHYIEEAGSDDERAFWKTMTQDKESHIVTLKELIKNSL